MKDASHTFILHRKDKCSYVFKFDENGNVKFKNVDDRDAMVNHIWLFFLSEDCRLSRLESELFEGYKRFNMHDIKKVLKWAKEYMESKLNF